MPTLYRAHLHAMNPVDCTLEECRIDELDPAPVGAESLVADDQRQGDRIDPKDQRPFLRHDVVEHGARRGIAS